MDIFLAFYHLVSMVAIALALTLLVPPPVYFAGLLVVAVGNYVFFLYHCRKFTQGLDRPPNMW